jgi:urease accessory protein
MLDRNPQKMQRAIGRSEVQFEARGLSRLYQSGCMKVLLPNTYGRTAEAVIINTSGGVTGGDRLSFSGQCSADAALCITSQAAERVYRTVVNPAEISNTLTLGPRARLDWLPQETILFEGSQLKRQLDISLAESARLLALETIVLGRGAAGEVLQDVSLSDQWRVRRGGKLVFADGLRFCGLPGNSLATFGANTALGSLLYVAPDAEARLSEVRHLISGFNAAASAWNGLLSVRFIAADLFLLRQALIPFLIAFRGEGLPRVWHM